ncbi:hypothetical protein P879_01659 [Paragonimus westermani]|uniref:Protein XRP2 n=1 Tax=Paragonimus westermani TaxID=34504 RepID=A0A8T0D3D2_9TREM|nr:hypothetical protein P879_01659 [Paragonimus westermani]
MNVFFFCCFVRQLRRTGKSHKEVELEPPITYPWHEKELLDPNDYIIENKDHGVHGRLPGEIRGQQFVIRNCMNVKIYLLDHINTVMIDDCENCAILTGPIKTSIFIRDCINCRVMTSCQQFRSRDCHDLVIFLACVTEPIVESSTNMQFGPYQCHYAELEDQFRASGLSIFNCNWSDIYDFTPDHENGANIKLLAISNDARNYFVPPKEAIEDELKTATENGVHDEDTVALTKSLSSVSLSLDPKDSLVPITLGNRVLHGSSKTELGNVQLDGCAVIAVFDHLGAVSCAKSIVGFLKEIPSCHFVRTQCSRFSEYDIERIFGIPTSSRRAKVGNVITFEVVGPRGSIGSTCEEVALKTSALHDPTFLLVTSDQNEAERQINLLNGLHRMNMNAS